MRTGGGTGPLARSDRNGCSSSCRNCYYARRRNPSADQTPGSRDSDAISGASANVGAIRSGDACGPV